MKIICNSDINTINEVSLGKSHAYFLELSVTAFHAAVAALSVGDRLHMLLSSTEFLWPSLEWLGGAGLWRVDWPFSGICKSGFRILPVSLRLFCLPELLNTCVFFSFWRSAVLRVVTDPCDQPKIKALQSEPQVGCSGPK